MAAAEVQTPFVGNTGPQTAHSGKDELDQLKEIAKQALQEHERLKKKYEESQRIQKRLKDQLVSREQELIRIQNVSEAACDEFAEIKAQLEVEQFCREEAESYATKMVKQNKSIKRKSAAILGVNNWASIEISLEEDDEDGTHENTSEQERLNGLKDELTALRKDLDVASEDKIVLKAELKALKQQLEQERLSNSALKDALKQRDRSIQQLSRVSTLVVSEFEEISENYERETVLRKKAECFAAKMYQENKVVSEVAKRQSQILMDPTQLTLPSDEKLMEAMKELEELNSMLVDKNEKQDKVRDELNTNEDNGQPKKEYVHTLETKLSIAQEENENLEQQINELQDELKKVKEQLEVASEKLRPPPPPPPPPLPAPVKNPLSLFRKLIKGKNTDDKQGKAGIQGKGKKDPLQEKYTATIDEMMKRIKSGKAGLKPVGEDERRPIERGRSSKLSRKNTPTPAMMELHGLLKKTSSNRPPLIKSSSESEATSEFLNIMNRRRQKMEIGESIKENGAKVGTAS